MLNLYDVVSLKQDDEEHKVKKGCIGTVIDVHAGGRAYTVEFVDDTGETIEDALFTEYEERELLLVTPFNKIQT